MKSSEWCVNLPKDIEIIEKVDYSTWLSNGILIVKSYRALHLCVDFIDLNDACLNDCYPLPSIDQLVEMMVGYGIMSFLDT